MILNIIIKLNNKIEKMKSTTLILAIFLLFSCASREIPPTFEDSNQILISKTINKLNLGKILKSVIDSNSSVIFLPIENYQPKHKPIINMIEDQIISSLYEDKFIILERDHIAVKKMILEGKENYILSTQNIEENNGNNQLNTHLDTGEIAIFYRVLELGIKYFEYSEDKKFKKREALASLHIRIQDINSGKILYADNLTSKLSDLVNQEYVNILGSFHYTFFSYDYPNQK